jgi:MFS family permease
MLAATGRLTIEWIYLFAVLGGIARAADVPARQSFIVEVAGRKVLGNAIALNSAMFNGARIVGPVIGTALLAAFGAAICFFLNAVSFLAIIAALLAVRSIYRRPRTISSRGLHDLLDGLRYVRAHRDIRLLLVLTAVFSLFGTYYRTLLPAFARDLYGVSETGYGILTSCLGTGALAGALVTAATSKNRRYPRWLVAGLALMCVSLFSLSLITNYVAACFALVLQGFGMITFLVSGNILVQHLADPAYQGRTMGVRHFVFGGLWTFGSLIAGYLGNYIGLRPTVAIGACVLLLALIIFARRVLKVDITDAPFPGHVGESAAK